MALTKLKNATNVMYNGYRPWSIIEVENPEALLLAGWIKLGEAEESKELALAEMTKAELLKFAAEKGIDIQNPSRTTADAIRSIIAEALEKEEALGDIFLKELMQKKKKVRIVCISDYGEKLLEMYDNWETAYKHWYIIGFVKSKDWFEIGELFL